MRRKKWRFFLFFMGFTSLEAGEIFSFLRTPISARGVGLGEAYAASVRDPFSLWWNPAGLANIEKRVIAEKPIEKEAEEELEEFLEESPPKEPPEIKEEFVLEWSFSGGKLVGDKDFAATALGFPFLGGSLGVGGFFQRVQGIEGYDAQGNPTGEIGYQNGGVLLGYALRQGISRIGFSVAGVQEKIGERNFAGGTLSVGMQVGPILLFRVGAYLENLIGLVPVGNTYQKIDTRLHVAIDITSPPPNVAKLLVGIRANLDDPEKEPLAFNLGVALSLSSFSYIMLGLKEGNPSGGIGLQIGFLHLAYALRRHLVLGDIEHFLELQFRF